MSESPPPLLLATTDTIAGYRIVRTLGYVEGVNYLVGHDRHPDLHGSVGRDRMVDAARRMGANAVVSVRWAGGSGGDMVHGVVYGTAVVAVPEAG
jgi:uncharacterized protein YbjQ (UPF0145 family)